MATNDPEFYQSPKFTPEPPLPPPRQRGCFFYGCLISGILIALVAILVAIGSYLVYRGLNQLVDQYTATTPEELPKVEMSPEERQSVKDRFEAFRTAVTNGAPTEPLVLTSADLNALIEENPDLNLKGQIYFAIEGDKIRSQVSFPLERLGLPLFKGRYLNGEADVKASLEDGILIVTLDSFEVNGKQPPPDVLDQLRQQNLAKDVYKNPKNAAMIRKLEKIEIKDGKIIIRVRAKGEPASGPGPDQKELPTQVIAPAKAALAPATQPELKVEPPTPASGAPAAAPATAPAAKPQ